MATRTRLVRNAVKVDSRIYYFRLTAADFPAGATSDDVALALPDNSFIEAAWLDLKIKFAAPDATDAQFAVGVNGNTDLLIEETDVHTSGTLGIQCTMGEAALPRWGATHAILATLVLIGDNCADLTAGEVHVYVRVSEVDAR